MLLSDHHLERLRRLIHKAPEESAIRPIPEVRAYPRAPMRMLVSVVTRQVGDDFRTTVETENAEILNLSRQGARIRTLGQVANQRVYVRILAPDAGARLIESTVVWQDDSPSGGPYEYGLKFLRLLPESEFAALLHAPQEATSTVPAHRGS